MKIPCSINSRIPKILYMVIALLLFVWSAYIFIYGRGGVLKRTQLKNEISRLKVEIRRLEEDKEILEWKLNNFDNNSKFIETIAREMGYKKPGEVIFKLIKKEELLGEKNTYNKNP